MDATGTEELREIPPPPPPPPPPVTVNVNVPAIAGEGLSDDRIAAFVKELTPILRQVLRTELEGLVAAPQEKPLPTLREVTAGTAALRAVGRALTSPGIGSGEEIAIVRNGEALCGVRAGEFAAGLASGLRALTESPKVVHLPQALAYLESLSEEEVKTGHVSIRRGSLGGTNLPGDGYAFTFRELRDELRELLR